MPVVAYESGRSAAQVHSSLKRSLAALEEARQCAVLWFGEVMRRRLFVGLGYSSINQYAMQELGFSKSRTRDFVRLARGLEELPAVRAAVASGELGYAKAREILPVATPANEQKWLAVAKKPRRGLVKEVKRVKRAAKMVSGQGELLPGEPTAVAPEELPVDLRIRLTPEQEARRAALVEKLHKLGTAPTDRAELLLEALAALVEQNEGPRGPLAPPVQVHVHQCPDCGSTKAESRELGPADRERITCDAAVAAPGKRNTTTIPPRIRREVLARDRRRCQSPGCGRTRFLEVHHLQPRNEGGSNRLENLVTLCSACHRLRHTGLGICRDGDIADGQDLVYGRCLVAAHITTNDEVGSCAEPSNTNDFRPARRSPTRSPMASVCWAPSRAW